MKDYVSSKGKVYKYVYHYANLYRINFKINNKDIVKTVPDTYTKTQVRIEITTLMRENGLNEAKIEKAMEGWDNDDKTHSREVNFPLEKNKTGYLGVIHSASFSTGQFFSHYKRETRAIFTYPIRKFSEGIYWVKKKELLNAYEQACNESDIKRYGRIIARKRPELKLNLRNEMNDYRLRKNRVGQVDQAIITDSITTLINTINASNEKTEYVSLQNVTGHELVHPYISSSRIGFKITHISKPLYNETFTTKLIKAKDYTYTYNENKLINKYIEACLYADNKFDLSVKSNSEYIKLLKVIDWEKHIPKALMRENKKPHIQNITLNPIDNSSGTKKADTKKADTEKADTEKADTEKMLSRIPKIKPFISTDKIGYTFSNTDDSDYKNTRAIPVKKLKDNLYWAHPNKIISLYVEVYKLASKSIGLNGARKNALLAEKSKKQWLELINKHFNDISKSENGIRVCFNETIGELRKQIKAEESAKKINALLEETINIKNTKSETGHPTVKVKVDGPHAIYFAKIGSNNVESKAKLDRAGNGEYTIIRRKLIKAFVIICRKADRHRGITQIDDNTYKSLYKDIDLLAKAREKNKRFKSIVITD